MIQELLKTLLQGFTKIKSYLAVPNIRYQILGFLSLFTFIILFYFLIGKKETFDTYALITNSLFFILVAVAILFIVIRFNAEDTLKKRFFNVLLGTSIACVLAIGLYFLITFMAGYPAFSDAISYAIQGLLIMGIVYFIYRYVKSKISLSNKLGRENIFTRLFNILKGYILNIYNTFKEAPKYVYILFLIQMLAITLWFIVPYLDKKISTFGSKILLDSPIYINKPKTLAKYSDLNNSSDEEHKFSYKYGISAWIYIDNNGPNMNSNSNEYVSIFNYGFRPDIVYNRSLNTLRILMREGKNNNKIVYETSNIKQQKWNHFVINYDSGIGDIFLNGQLVSTKNDIIPYMKRDLIQSGTKNGVNGGICNVLYYPKPLSKITIDWLYNKYKDKKTPSL